MFRAFESPGAGQGIFSRFSPGSPFRALPTFEHERLIKEGFGIHALLTPSLFACDIPHTPGEYISVQICALQPPVRLAIFLSNGSVTPKNQT